MDLDAALYDSLRNIARCFQLPQYTTKNLALCPLNFTLRDKANQSPLNHLEKFVLRPPGALFLSAGQNSSGLIPCRIHQLPTQCILSINSHLDIIPAL